LKDHAQAKTYLQPLAEGEYSNYQQAARWYLGLSEIQLGNVDAARNWLEKIAGPNGNLPQKATKLLEELE